MEPFLGEIRMVGFNFAPQGWAFCNGQLLSISSNAALFSLLGTTYGGNGQTTFQLPNLQGRFPMNQGNGPGLTPRTIGEISGAESVNILTSNMPTHTHVATFTPSGGGGNPTVTVNIQGSNQPGTTTTPTGNYLAGTPKGLPADGLYTPNAGTPGNIAGVTATLSGVSGGGGTVTNAVTGGSAPLATLPPFLVVNFIIALQGIFPPRS